MATPTHKCRYCGHEGKARGKGAELVYDRFGSTVSHYCKDAEACGARIRQQSGVTLKELALECARSGLPF